jgi:hypothetical protein
MESMSEKQSTTLGPSEASSSQTSEAAAPLIHSTLGAMSMRFASSSDTTGTFSYNASQFNALLGALPPPIDGEESDENSDELVFNEVSNSSFDFESTKQFEDELKIQCVPKWKNDFFAVDSVKSLPTSDSADVSEWVSFPTKSAGEEVRRQIPSSVQMDGEKKKSVVSTCQQRPSSSSESFAVKPPPYLTKDTRTYAPSSKPTFSSLHSSISRKVNTIQSDTENRVPQSDGKSTTEAKSGTGAYRRFDVHRVRAFQQARRTKSLTSA